MSNFTIQFNKLSNMFDVKDDTGIVHSYENYTQAMYRLNHEQEQEILKQRNIINFNRGI